MDTEIILDTKLVGDIQGKFIIPSYQRGYRWGESEVTRLLDDIYANGGKNYCLQPVVVKRDEKERFELIDGQQRLTTLFILLQYIRKEYKPRIRINFSLEYTTREQSAQYLENIEEDLADTNIDFFHIYRAYQAIDAWFQRQKNDVVAADHVYGYLIEHVKIIWYEVGKSEDPISLFTRLNIGKIPLTSAELVKAMFLSHAGNENVGREKQEEISLQWDNMEKELNHNALWYFLTNRSSGQYQTRIDLILDLISGKGEANRDKYYTFFRFDELKQENSLNDIWRKIQQTFLILKDWYEDHDLYHKIGYLIASGFLSLSRIYELSQGKTKDEFRTLLDDHIRRSVDIPGDYTELSYDDPNDRKRISTLLLLFNVESVRKIDEQTQRFPFDQFKAGKDGRVAWTLEHIHAQQSEGLRTQEMWKEWLGMHIPSVQAVGGEQAADLIQAMEKARDQVKLDRAEFDDLQQKVVDLLSAEGSTEYLHTIGNLALLNAGDNAALSNAAFDVKRNMIISMDRRGQYIPFCTKMVFLKYYTPSAENQLHFWGQADRVAYVQAINEVLKEYLKPIPLEKEEV